MNVTTKSEEPQLPVLRSGALAPLGMPRMNTDAHGCGYFHPCLSVFICGCPSSAHEIRTKSSPIPAFEALERFCVIVLDKRAKTPAACELRAVPLGAAVGSAMNGGAGHDFAVSVILVAHAHGGGNGALMRGVSLV